MIIKDLYRVYDTGKWNIAVDNDEKMLECPECHCRAILRDYLRAIGTRGLNYCPYCGEPMQESKK